MTLTVERMSDDSGDFKASLDGYYHATGWCEAEAVNALFRFMYANHRDVWAERNREILAWFDTKVENESRPARLNSSQPTDAENSK